MLGSTGPRFRTQVLLLLLDCGDHAAQTEVVQVIGGRATSRAGVGL